MRPCKAQSPELGAKETRAPRVAAAWVRSLYGQSVDGQTSFLFLPRFSEEVMAVLSGGRRGIQGSRSPGGEDTGGGRWEAPTHRWWMVILAPETSILETCMFVAICIFNKDSP